MTWFRIERVTWAERALWLGLVLGSVAPLALRPAPEAVMRAYVEAVNRGDPDAALGLTGTDFVLRPSLGGQYRRRDEVRGVLEYRAALHERWGVVDWEYDPVDREVHALVEVTNDAWEVLRIRPQVEVVLVVRNTRLILEQPRADSRELIRALEPFLAWAAAERPRELARVWYGGQPVRRKDAARRLVALLAAWRAETAPVAERAPEEQA